MNKFILLVCVTTILSCGPKDPNKEIDEGNVVDQTYTSAELGWSIAIPTGWEVISKSEQQDDVERGLAMVKESVGEQIDASGVKHLISFQKDDYNLFRSTSETMVLDYADEWNDVQKSMKQLIYQTFSDHGIECDTSSGAEQIDGVDFNVFHTQIIRNDEVLLYQDIYTAYLNGQNFSVNLNYNDEKNKKAMMDAWKASKFERK